MQYFNRHAHHKHFGVQYLIFISGFLGKVFDKSKKPADEETESWLAIYYKDEDDYFGKVEGITPKALSRLMSQVRVLQNIDDEVLK